MTEPELQPTTKPMFYAAMAFWLSACTYDGAEAPDLQAGMPAAYDFSGAAGTAPGAAPAGDTEWWAAFGDASVAPLVAEALLANQNLASGRAALRSARAAVRIAGASLYPDLQFGASGSSSTVTGLDDVSSTGRLSAGYQLDLFGANRARRHGAVARHDAQRFDLRALELSVQADTAFTYFSVLALRERLQVAQANLDISERIYRIVQTRYRAGAVSRFDLVSQEAALANARAQVVALKPDVVSLETALAVLLGRAPQGFEAPAGQLMATSLPSLDPGLPADLLLRRPDLLSAQAVVRGSGADVAVARAAFFPTVDLTAAWSESGLGSIGNPVESLAASLAAPIFSGGALEGGLEQARAGVDQAVAAYRQATLDALRDVDVSLSTLSAAERRESELLLARNAAERALSLAEVRYRSGADDLTSLLNAQTTLFDASDAVVQARLSRLSAAIDLFVAVGGEWGA